MLNTNYNIAIIGQTGVGKSSLINYIYGEKKVETGTGRPVTKNGFHKVNHTIEGMEVTIYDSWGLEVGKEEQWLKELQHELSHRGINAHISEWFHSIFYCISAPSARIQDADIKIIKELQGKKNKVSIILTKADAISEEEEEIFVNAIKKELGSSIAILPVCSEGKKTRSGETKPFGKELVEKQSLIDLVDSLILRIPQHCQNSVSSKLDDWQTKMHKMIDEELGFLGYNAEKLQNKISEESQKIVKEIEDLSTEKEKAALEHYTFILEKLRHRIKIYDSNYSKQSFFNYFTFYIDWTKMDLPLSLNMLIKFSKTAHAFVMHNRIDSICSSLTKKINDRTNELDMSLKAIKGDLEREMLS